MEHPWRPHQNQGNICPTCSISHFPFCPPNPHPSNFNPNYYPINTTRPSYNHPGDPYYDPGYSNRNPSLPHMGDFGNANRAPYSMQNPGYGDGGYVGNDYNNVVDRSSKRLRVDGAYDGSYGAGTGTGAGGDGNLSSRFPVEGNDERLKLGHDHGGPNLGYGVGGDARGYAPERLVFDKDADGRHPGNSSEFGLRPPNNMGASGAPGMGYNVHYPRDGLDYQLGYGSQYDMKRGASDVGFQSHDQCDLYGQIGKPPDLTSFYQGGVGHGSHQQSNGYHHPHYGSSYGSNDGVYGSDESRHPSNGSVHYDQRSNVPTPNRYSSSHLPVPSAMQQSGQLRYDYGSPHHFSDVRQPPPVEGFQVPAGNQNPPIRPHYGLPHMDYQGGYGNTISENMGHSHQRAPQRFDVHPPLPSSPPPPPPPPLPMEPPPACWPAEHKPLPSPPRVSSSLFLVSVDSSIPVHSSHAPISESRIRPNLLPISQHGHTTRGDFQRDPQSSLRSYGQYLGDGQTYPSKSNFPDKPKIIDASHLFKPPHRASRPDHFVIILRGLPGSGKSYLAKILRDLEVEHGGKAPRIHSMDDYFMTEVEKVEENEGSKSSARVKKPTMKTVLEYCYEPEMEEAYRSSMLKAFKKTLDDGAFTFVIVDDRNLRVADFAQFWATAKRSGYEVYVLEAPYKDPAGCTARNVHGFTQVDMEKMAAQWEAAPSMYLQVDVKSLFHGDDLKESNIEEVDMDTEDGGEDGGFFKVEEGAAEKTVTSSAGNLRNHGLQKDVADFDADVGNTLEEVKDLGRSKWSNLDGDEDKRTEVLKRKPKVLSGLAGTFVREGKSVHWGDKTGHTGFSIGAVKKANLASLVIGPGAGYNLKSNPLPEEDATTGYPGETKKHRSVFQERLRAEQESFKAVFDRRRHRIGGLDAEDD